MGSAQAVVRVFSYAIAEILHQMCAGLQIAGGHTRTQHSHTHLSDTGDTTHYSFTARVGSAVHITHVILLRVVYPTLLVTQAAEGRRYTIERADLGLRICTAASVASGCLSSSHRLRPEGDTRHMHVSAMQIAGLHTCSCVCRVWRRRLHCAGRET